MRDVRNQELLSAYLDGELTADERKLVERRLVDEPDVRGLLEQLRRQREWLQALPRRPAPADFQQRVLARIAEAVPRAGNAKLALGRPRRRSAWRVGFLGAAALALGWLVMWVVYPPQRPAGPGPGDVALNPPPSPVPQIPDSSPESPGGVEPRTDLPVDQLAVQGLQRSATLFLVLDLAITPQGQTAQVFERTLEKAGIDIGKTVAIEERLEADLLSSRFLGDEQMTPTIGAGEANGDPVDIYFVRAPAGKIDAFQRQLNELHFGSDLLKRRLDIAIGTRELEIFLRLNDAAEQPSTGLARAEAWQKPGGYQLRFRFGLHSLSLSRFGAISAPVGVERVAEPGKSSGGLSLDDFLRPTAPSTGASGKKLAADGSATPKEGSTTDARVDAEAQAEKLAHVLIVVRNLR
ncbi:MAG: anti-sigma factor [Pirellulaceae bacterium]